MGGGESGSTEGEGGRWQRRDLFISYSHHDQRWLDELHLHFNALDWGDALRIWDDRRLKPGDLWREEIEKALARARVALLLVSKHFLASEFIRRRELPPLLAAAQQDGLKILWLPVGPCNWKRVREIEQYQAVIPVSPTSPTLGEMGEGERDRALVGLTDHIDDLFARLEQERQVEESQKEERQKEPPGPRQAEAEREEREAVERVEREEREAAEREALAEAERKERVEAEAEWVEAERKDREEREAAEREALAEADRLERLRVEAEARAEVERLRADAERVEAERKELAEADRLERLRAEAEARAEVERLRAEVERLARDKEELLRQVPTPPASARQEQAARQEESPRAPSLITIATSRGWLAREGGAWQLKQEPITVSGYQEELVEGEVLTLIQIPEGSFLMGSPKDEIDRYPDEGPQHTA